MKRLLMITMTLWLLPSAASASIGNEYLGEVIVHVEGAARTKDRYIESLVEKCLVKEDYRAWDTVDSTQLGQCLTNTRIFSSVEVTVKKPEITVKVSERWTLLPIPNVYATNGKRSAGAFVYESNLFGYGKIAVAGGAISTEGSSFSLMYIDPSVMLSDYTCNVMAIRSNVDAEAFEKKSVLYSYNKVEDGFTLSPGYRITQRLQTSVTMNYTGKRYAQRESFAVPQDYYAWALGARAIYRNADYKLFYNDGFSATIVWNRQVHRSDEGEHLSNATAGFDWDKLMFGKHALQLGLHAARQTGGGVGDVSTFGRAKGYRGIQPGGLWTSEVVAASADYQIPVVQRGHGTVTVAPFVDYGVYKPFFEGNGANYSAYGIGAYYFINLINLPGIGLTIGNNENFMGAFAAFQIGFGFN